MKLYLLICITLFHSCSYKPLDKHLVSSEYVVDSTLERNYKEYEDCYFIPNNHDGKSVETAQKAFEIAKPILYEMNKNNIENLTPIHIRLIEDKIWIIYGFPQTKNNEIIMGGGLYIEMKKSNGAIIKAIIEE